MKETKYYFIGSVLLFGILASPWVFSAPISSQLPVPQKLIYQGIFYGPKALGIIEVIAPTVPLKNPTVRIRKIGSEKTMSTCVVIEEKEKTYEMECQATELPVFSTKALLVIYSDHSELRFGTWLSGYKHFQVKKLNLASKKLAFY